MKRSWREALVVLLIASLGLASQVLAGNATTQPSVVRIGVTVGDMKRSVEFFEKVLDFNKVSDTEVAGEDYEKLVGVFGVRSRIVRLRLGHEELELTQFLAASIPGRPVPAGSRSNDRWFQHIAIVTSDIDAAYRRLRHHDVQHASTGPQRLPTWNPNAGGISAFYFHDPDGHVLEVINFPLGKGDPRWQNARGLFLGIDHTAIVVSDTKASLAFYREKVGLHIAGQSENYGTEQAHLNNVRDAQVRITSLRGTTGPGIEFLEYISPRDGRAFPTNARPNDLFHWQTTVSTGDAAARPQLVRDPDGHAMLITK